MDKFTVITVPQDLLPQVVGELLLHALNPDHVLVVHDDTGRVIHAHPEVAEAWFRFHEAKESAPKVEPEPISKPIAAEDFKTPAPAGVLPVSEPAPSPSTEATAPKSKTTTPPLS